MLKTQENKLTMYGAVRTYLEDNSDLYSGIAEFVENKSSFIQLLNDLSGKEDERMNAKKGKLDLKLTTRDSVTSLAVTISSALFAYAKKIDDLELRHKAALTLSSFNRIRDSELPITLRSIKELASASLTDLGTFGITADMVTDFQVRIEKYERALGSKESSGAVKTGAAGTLATLFRETDSVLESIDKLMENFRDSNAQFYRGYKASRIVKRTGVRHRKDVAVPESTPSENK